jgi:hyperosmotically inducible periplasmic protein
MNPLWLFQDHLAPQPGSPPTDLPHSQDSIHKETNSLKKILFSIAFVGLSTFLASGCTATKNTGVAVGAGTNEAAGQVGDKTTDVAGQVGDKTTDVAGQVGDKTTDVAGQVGDKTTDVAKQVGDKTTDVAGQVGDKITDASITAAVKMKMADDPNVSAMNINVDTTDGNVTLSGTVKDQAETDKAVQIAKSVDGVKSVESTKLIASLQ